MTPALSHLTTDYLQPRRGRVTVNVADLNAALTQLARGRLTSNGRRLTKSSAQSVVVAQYLKGLSPEMIDRFPGVMSVLAAFDKAVGSGDPTVSIPTADMTELLTVLYAYLPESSSKTVHGVEDVVRIVMPLLAPLEHERILVVTLSTGSRVQEVLQVAQGGQSGASITASSLLRAVLKARNSSAFILVHNHPSGNPEPSLDDIEITKILKVAAKTVGLEMLDHIIVTRGVWVSMLERGYM